MSPRAVGLLVGLLAAGAPVMLAGQAGRISYESFAMPSGLRVVYSEDHSTPIVTVDLWYHAGARNERPGRSGFAHLFEHMMFQGSAHVKKSEHFQLVERAGGTLNGSTHDDYTNYYETIPSNRLNLALWLEADRMRSLVSCDYKLAPGTMRRDVQDEHANLAAAFRVYRLPPHTDPDLPAVELLNVILGQGESSRLNVGVVRREKAALQAGMFALTERHGPGVLVAYGIANQGVRVQALDSLIGAQLDSVRAAGVTADELTRARNTFRADFIHERETSFGRAEALQHYGLFHGSIAEINTDLDRYLAVSAADIRRVATKYLDPANAVIVSVRPKVAPTDSGATK